MFKKENSNNAPEAYITKNKQRIKQYDNSNVYLKNGDEFEIELFNPTSYKLLAKITVNNVSIGAGIVLKPGERVFLDRYTSEAKKFLFDTYTVDSNNSRAMKAIEKNGVVGISFYKENTFNSPYSRIDFSSFDDDLTIPYTNIFYGKTNVNTLEGPNYRGLDADMVDGAHATNFTPKGANTWASSGTLYCSTSNNGILTSCSTKTPDNIFLTASSVKSSSEPIRSSKPMETGRIEKGSYSDQKFKTSSAIFEYNSSWYIEWNLLPESIKNLTKNDLTVYCSKCGRKKRNNENFCPSCGTKFIINEPKIKIEKGDTVVIKSMNAISYVKDISLDGDGNEIYFVTYPGNNRWYKRNQIEFNHKNEF